MNLYIISSIHHLYLIYLFLFISDLHRISPEIKRHCVLDRGRCFLPLAGFAA